MSYAKEYLKSYRDYFWQYEDGGKVIAIPNSYTIGYSEKVIFDFVKFIAPQGLPPFGSLLLTIIATNSNGPNSIDQIERILANELKDSEEIKAGIKFAKLLTSIPVQYKKGNLRIELLRSLFLNCHNSIGRKKSSYILGNLNSNYNSSALFTTEKKTITLGQKVRDFRTLALIGRTTNTVESILQQISNLPSDIEYEEIIEEELQQVGKEGDLVTQLVANQETFHIGSLIQRIWSGLTIPIHSYIPSQQPLGGIADITNKGNFDKLLISEFAYEDEVLMSRLANNESLYHHREIPPSDNDFERVILVDITLKNWGTIRSIAYAIMIAITHHPKNKSTCHVFLVGKTFNKIEYQTVHQIIESFGILDPTLDPGIGMQQFFEEHKSHNSEIFFITNQNVLSQPNMLKQQSDFSKSIQHWIHPTSEGTISIFKNSKSGKKFITKIKLPLDELWKRKTNINKHQKNTDEYNTQYPILFPHHRMKSMWQNGTHIFAVSKQNSLLKFYSNLANTNSSGWELINEEKIEPYNLLSAVVLDNNSTTALIKTTLQEYYLIFSSNKKRIKIEDSKKWWRSAKVEVSNAQFYLLKDNNTSIITTKGKVSHESVRTNISSAEINTSITPNVKQVFKNITTITITQDHLLRLNKHDLCLFKNNIQLKTHQDRTNTIKRHSSKTGEGVFTFIDGSKIIHNKTGMLTLISRNKSLPKIYVPSVLTSNLGVATDTIFAGSQYYRKTKRYICTLPKIFPDTFHAIKNLKNILGIGLKEATLMIDQRQITNIPANKIDELNKVFNIQTTITSNGIDQTEISDIEFYNNYINRYIEEILAYEN